MIKNIILFGLIAFSLGGCQKNIAPLGSIPAEYAKEFSRTQPKNFLVSVFVSYDSLSKWINQRPDKTIFESKSDQSFIGFPIQTSLAGPVKLSSINSNHLMVQAPAIFEAKPNVAGFNAGVVRGKLDLNLNFDIQLMSLNKLAVRNVSYVYQWVEKPMVKVAGFGVNVSPVVDNLLKNKYNEVKKAIQSNLESLLDSTSLERLLVNNAQNINWPDYTFPSSAVGLGIKKINLSPKGLNLELLLKTSIGLVIAKTNFDKKQKIHYYLNQDAKFGRELPFSGKLDWNTLNEFLTRLVQEKLTNKQVSIQVNGENTQYLQAQVLGFKGSRSKLKIDFLPVLIDQHILGLKVVHQELRGLSFPRSLFKKQAIRRINHLANDFNYDLLKSSELLNSFSGSIVMDKPKLTIDLLQWNESSFYISGSLGADWKILK